MAVLFLKEMRFWPKDPRNPSNDRFILSKRLSFVDVATGSLGQGLSNAAGMAFVGKYIDRASYRVYCVTGDGELSEGSIWEAIAFSSHYKLDNLVLIVDVNRLGQSQATALGHDMFAYKARIESFGWHTIVLDGHCIPDLVDALVVARQVKKQPVALICKTFKGHAFPTVANEENWHGKPLGGKTSEVIASLEKELKMGPWGDVEVPVGTLSPSAPSESCAPTKLIGSISLPSSPPYKLNEEVSTRLAYGRALARLAETCDRVIGLDADTKNSTFSIKLLESKPSQFIECFIAEQNMVGVGIGAACRQRTVPFVSAFAAFLTRAYDQIRMGAVSMTNCNFVGSHAGVSIGQDGPSQMALEDLAMFRAVVGSTVFYPSDAVSTERAVELSANTPGICYIRTGRPNCRVIYKPDEVFAIGKGKVVRSAGSTKDALTVVGAGVTLFEALKAADQLADEGIQIRVIDPFTVKPMDVMLLKTAVTETCDTVITVEDHQPEGGLADAVSQALSAVQVKHVVHSLAVRGLPRSGEPGELLDKFAIDAGHVVEAVKKLLGK